MKGQFPKSSNGSISEQEQISLKIKEKEDMLNNIQSSLNDLNKSLIRVGISKARMQLRYDESDDVKSLEKLVSQYDEAIMARLSFQRVATTLYKSDRKNYNDNKSKIIGEITNDINRQKSNESDLQSKLNEIKDEIASEERKLLSKREDRQSLEKILEAIRLETKQLTEKIDEQKKEKEKLSDAITALKLSEAKAMRLKEKVANLALERIVQLYDLALQDTKVPRASSIPARMKEHEIVTPETPREMQEAQDVPGQQADSLAIREQEDVLQRSSEILTPQNKVTHRRFRRFKPKPAVVSESFLGKQATGGFSESDSDDELSRQLDKLNLGSSVPNEKSQQMNY